MGRAVLIWDSGEFQTEGDPEAALTKGKLTFSLKGHKLKGSFSTRPDERARNREGLASDQGKRHLRNRELANSRGTHAGQKRETD